jgi:hypothetical protein
VFRVQGDLQRQPPAIKPDSLATHRNCGLGDWYEANRNGALSKLPSFQALEPPHARLHGLVHEFAAALQAGERRQALQLMHDIDRELAATLEAIDALVRDIDALLAG